MQIHEPYNNVLLANTPHLLIKSRNERLAKQQPTFWHYFNLFILRECSFLHLKKKKKKGTKLLSYGYIKSFPPLSRWTRIRPSINIWLKNKLRELYHLSVFPFSFVFPNTATTPYRSKTTILIKTIIQGSSYTSVSKQYKFSHYSVLAQYE